MLEDQKRYAHLRIKYSYRQRRWYTVCCRLHIVTRQKKKETYPQTFEVVVILSAVFSLWLWHTSPCSTRICSSILLKLSKPRCRLNEHAHSWMLLLNYNPWWKNHWGRRMNTTTCQEKNWRAFFFSTKRQNVCVQAYMNVINCNGCNFFPASMQKTKTSCMCFDLICRN